MTTQCSSESRAKAEKGGARWQGEGIWEGNMPEGESTFAQMGQENPCVGCPAPCCRMQLIPYKRPETFMDMDHVHYMLLFPNTEVVVTATGDWFVLEWQECREFEASTCACRVHHSTVQPRICFYYNAYDCWYKKNFVGELPPQIYRLNLSRFEIWVNEILFDDKGKIVSAPCFEKSQEILKATPIEPTFQFQASMTRLQDVAIVGRGQALE